MKFLRKPFRYTYWNVSFALIIVNLAFYLVQRLVPQSTSYLALNTINVLYGHAWWQFATYMFAHDPYGISHILWNMLGLFFFGPAVERRMGSKEFLLFYMVTGVLAGALSFLIYWLTGAYGVMLMGASGALFAVQLAYATFYPDSLIYIWGILPVRAAPMVLGYTAITVFFSVTGLQGGVAHLTHLAGFGFAWLYFMARFGANPWYALVGRRR